MITMVGPHDKSKFLAQDGAILIDVTSHSTTWTQEFSPFILGPCKLYGPYGSFNVENAWQYAKVYQQHADQEGNPTEDYWRWAYKGWSNKRAERYPMGKGSIPLYSLWDGEKLGYSEAKKQIYVPLYEKAVHDSGYLPSLVQLISDLLSEGKPVGIFDFDVFDNDKLKITFDQIINSSRKLGHGFVLRRMVEKELS